MIVIRPIKSVSQFVNPVFYSLVSKKKDLVVENIAANFITYTQISILIFFPAGLILFFFSDNLIFVIFGNKWLEMVPIVTILSFLFFIRPITKINVEIFKALSLTGLMSKIYMVFTPLYILAILFSVQIGLNEVAISYVIVNYILAFVSLSYIIKKLNLPISKIFKKIKNILINNIILAIYYFTFIWLTTNYLNLDLWYYQMIILITGGMLPNITIVFPSQAFNYLLQFIMLITIYCN